MYGRGQERGNMESLQLSITYSEGCAVVWSCISTSDVGDFLQIDGIMNTGFDSPCNKAFRLAVVSN